MPIVPVEATKSPSPQLQAVLAYFDALAITHDVEALGAILLDNFTQQILPRSLERPLNDKAAFLKVGEASPLRNVEVGTNSVTLITFLNLNA